MMNFAETPHILTKSLGMPLYKGDAEGEVFAKDLTHTSPSPHLLETTLRNKKYEQIFCDYIEGDFAATPTKTFSQGREYFFLSVVTKTECDSLFADMRHLLRKIHTMYQIVSSKIGLGVGEVLRKDLTRPNTFI
ncbi:MAG: hypothetical protein J6O49_14940 [Bacteroidaceae bacterium]|nr:hypothetical protein [Bacteroidaceae bacterium]